MTAKSERGPALRGIAAASVAAVAVVVAMGAWDADGGSTTYHYAGIIQHAHAQDTELTANITQGVAPESQVTRGTTNPNQQVNTATVVGPTSPPDPTPPDPTPVDPTPTIPVVPPTVTPVSPIAVRAAEEAEAAAAEEGAAARRAAP